MTTLALDTARLDLPRAQAWTPGLLFALTVPWAAAISSISGPRIGGLHYTGFIWLAYLIWGGWILATSARPAAFPIGRWAPLILLAALSILWSGLLDSRPLQDLAQLSAGLVVAYAASIVVRSQEQLRALGRSFLASLWLIGLSFLFFYYGPGQAWHDPGRDLGFCVRPTAMTLVLIAIAIFLLRYASAAKAKGWIN